MITSALNVTYLEWEAKLPALKKEGEAIGFDGKAWLTGFLQAFAHARAEEVFLELGGFHAANSRSAQVLANRIENRGRILIEAWDVVLAQCGADREPWVAEAANRAASIYRERVEELMASACVGGSS